MAFTVQHTDNSNRWSGAIDYEIRMKRPKPHISRRQVLSGMTDPRHRGKFVKCSHEFGDQLIRNGRTIFRNKTPDIAKVLERHRRQTKLTHERCELRAVLSAFNWR